MAHEQPLDEKAVRKCFIDSCVSRLLKVFEEQSGLRLTIEAAAVSREVAIPGFPTLVGLEQLLERTPEAAFWIGFDESQTVQIGELLVQADRAGGSDPQNALIGLLRSSLDTAAKEAATKFQLGNLRNAAPHHFVPGDSKALAPIRFSGPEGIAFSLYLGLSPQFSGLIGNPATVQTLPAPSGASVAKPAQTGGTLDMLLDFELNVSVSFGRTKLAFKDVLKLAPSSVVELNRAPDDLVEVMVNNSVIAWGEVVVIDGQYGVRIRRIASGGIKSESLGETVQA